MIDGILAAAVLADLVLNAAAGWRLRETATVRSGDQEGLRLPGVRRRRRG
jgi:hypothetical protein